MISSNVSGPSSLADRFGRHGAGVARARGTWLAATLASLLIAGCASLPRTAFTQAEQAAAAPPGFHHVRYVQDDPQLRRLLRTALRAAPDGEVDALALSGGGANGAYGAGLLHGWTLAGGRPDFQVVTGVSAGALTAPLAFAGPAWDGALATAYTAPGVAHLLHPRGLLSLFTPGLYRHRPLRDLVAGYVTDDLLRAIAAEDAKGRRLLVATTNLDTEHLVVWDMGAIAAHGGPEARALFIAVLVASASVPGVFPPAMINVESGGRAFAEMHVDGETASAFFAFPPEMLLAANPPDVPLRLKLHVIVNGQIDGRFAVTPLSTLAIVGRSFVVEGKASAASMLIATAQFCRDHGCALRVASLPPTTIDDPLDFSTAHERALFRAGEAAIGAHRAWRDLAPRSP